MTDKTAENVLSMMDMSRSRKRWRLVAVLLFIFLMLTFGDDHASTQPEDAYIAGVKIEGFIGDNPELVNELQNLQKDDAVQGVVIYVDSPGGSMQAALDVYHAIRRLAEEKPVVAKMGQMAASAGYLVAIAADHIVAGEATLTGSVGVFLPLVDATAFAQKLGVESRTIYSGEDKLATSPFDEVSKSSEKYLQTLVNDLQTVFLGYVTERRSLTAPALDIIKTGRSFIGLTAKEFGLVDALSHESTAMMWLKNEKKLPQELKIYWRDTQEEKPWLAQLLEPMNLFTFSTVSKPQGALSLTQYK